MMDAETINALRHAVVTECVCADLTFTIKIKPTPSSVLEDRLVASQLVGRVLRKTVFPSEPNTEPLSLLDILSGALIAPAQPPQRRALSVRYRAKDVQELDDGTILVPSESRELVSVETIPTHGEQKLLDEIKSLRQENIALKLAIHGMARLVTEDT